MANNDQARAGGKPGKMEKQGACQCPFCDARVEETRPFCKACGRDLRRCPTCGRVLAAAETKCPHCA
jgi:hypothetical protein